MKIQLNKSGIFSFPSDLQGLSYSDAVNQLDLLEQNAELIVDRQAEDTLCLTDGTDEEADFYLYTIEED